MAATVSADPQKAQCPEKQTSVVRLGISEETQMGKSKKKRTLTNRGSGVVKGNDGYDTYDEVEIGEEREDLMGAGAEGGGGGG